MTDEEVIDIEVEEAQNLPAVRASEAVVARGELSVQEIVDQKDKIKQVMGAVMKDGVHYGVIPGVNKPSLFKPGAEAINVALRLAPHYESEKIFHDDGHLTVIAKCTLKHIPTDLTIATGEGLCTTKEDRYAYRQGERICPQCGQPAIIKGKAEYGGGWVCFKKKGGCGLKWDDGAQEIESQEVGKIPNPQLPDLYNTVLKMADKRALIAAVLNGTAASDVFTQDVEDGPQGPKPQPPSPVRRDNEGLAPPTTWAKITEYASAYDEHTYETFMRFADAARRRLFPGSVSTEKLSKEERNELFRVSSRAVVALRSNVDPSEFPMPSIEDLRRAWAEAMEGEELAIEGEE
jgi:hypothetical protein